MKKLLSILLVISLCFSMFAISVAAASEDIVVSINGGNVKQGGTITVPINLDVNKGFTTLGIQVYYDSDVLEIECPNHKAGQNCSPSVVKNNLSSGNNGLNSQYHTVNPYLLQWAYPNVDGSITKNVTKTGQLAKITFKVKNNAPVGETKISVVVDQASTYNGTRLNTIGGEASVKIICGHVYDNNCDSICNVCREERTVPHSFEWVIDEKSTCALAGIKHEECKDCHVRRNENTKIPATGKHTYTNACDSICNVCNTERPITHSYKWIIDVPSTCAETGLKHQECSVCKNIASANTVIPKSNVHTYKDNCDEYCDVCSAKRTAPHSRKITITPATTSKDGKAVKKCTVCGSVSSTRVIKKIQSVTLSTTAYTYNGKAKQPGVTVKDSAGNKIASKFYTVTYAKGRINAGTYKVTVAFKGDYSGSKTVSFKINPASTAKFKVSLSKTSYTYNGKVQTPTVTVKDSAGKKVSAANYTVTYQTGRKNVGKYKVTIKYKGNYSGSKTLYFNIVAPSVPTTTVSKLVSGKRNATVYITQKSQVTGYQIQYATNKKFTGAKTKTINSYKTTKTTLSGLSAKKYYYVRVRTYKTVGGKNFYSGWSTVKYVKTK